MTRPPHKWISAEIAQHVHGMGEAPRDDKPAPRKEPPHPLALAYIAMPLVFLVLLVGAAILWGKL